MKFVVHTQFMENYGAHSESGKFADGQAYWKMKGGETYIVKDLDREQDAVAFVAALVMSNEIGYKEFPVKWETFNEWYSREIAAETDEEYRKHKKEMALVVSPQQPKESKRLINVWGFGQ